MHIYIYILTSITMLGYLYSLTNESWHQKLFIYGMYFSYILFAIALTGVIYVSPDDLIRLRSFLTYYVCGFILLRFNPFIAPKALSKTDSAFERRVVFSSAIFLLLTTSLTNLSLAYIERHIQI